MKKMLDTTLKDELRKAKQVLYIAVNAALIYYGTVILVRGTLDLFYDEGQKLLLIAVGLAGLRLYLRWTEPWVVGSWGREAGNVRS